MLCYGNITENSYICTRKSSLFRPCLAMRHFSSTTTKLEYENRGVLAHKGLQEQPEGVRKAKIERFSLFFVIYIHNQQLSASGLYGAVWLGYGTPERRGVPKKGGGQEKK